MSNVVVRIYDVVSKPDDKGKVHRFTVSLSMPEEQAFRVERNSPSALAEAFGRAQRILSRDNISVEIESATWVRELLIHSSRAKQTGTAA